MDTRSGSVNDAYLRMVPGMRNAAIHDDRPAGPVAASASQAEQPTSGGIAVARLPLADRQMPDGRPGFDPQVPPGGYLWWYVDGLSDCGRFGLTVIGFVGSVFSPYYHWSGRGDPENHCAINVALYGPKARWCMTERGRRQMARDQARFVVGGSAMAWEGDDLVITVDETAVPLPRRVKGTIRLTPHLVTDQAIDLDGRGRHGWWPSAPLARLDVAFSEPGLAWRGHGYLDTNWGSEPLEDGFREWDWARADLGDRAVILYDGIRRSGDLFSFGVEIGQDGAFDVFPPPPKTDLPPGRIWRVPRRTHVEAGGQSDAGDTPGPRAHIRRTFEDTPFYTRSELVTRLGGETLSAVHESIDLDRLRRTWVKCLLPFRMPRWPFGRAPIDTRP